MDPILILLPEFLLLATFVGLLVADITYTGERLRLISVVALIGIFATFFQMLVSFKGLPLSVADGVFRVDGVSVFLKYVIISLAGFSTYLASTSSEVDRAKHTELFSFIILGTLLGFVAVSSNHLVLTGLCLMGLLSIAVFASCYSSRTLASTESAVSLVVPLIVSASLFWVAVLFILIGTGSYDYIEIRKAIVLGNDFQLWVFLAAVFAFFGLIAFFGLLPGGLQLSRWMSGVPTPAAAFLVHLLRVVALGVAIRLASTFIPEHANALSFGERGFVWSLLISVVAVISLLYGGVMSLRAKSLRALLANLFIVQGGFWMVGLVALSSRAMPSLFFSLWVDFFASFGALVIVSNVMDRYGDDTSQSLLKIRESGVYFEVILLLFFLFNFIGLPPSIGFFGKAQLLSAALEGPFTWVVVVALVAWVISGIAFTRLVLELFGSKLAPAGAYFLSASSHKRLILILMFLPLFLLIFSADFVLRWSEISLNFILW